MANVLRDFFILEFAIYNIGNVTKQFRWIAKGLSDVKDEFNAIDNVMQKINKSTSQLKELEAIASSLAKLIGRGVVRQDVLDRFTQTERKIQALRKEIINLSESIENMNVKAYVSNKLFTNLAAIIVTKFGALSLVFKTFLDNFVRLEREAISLANTLGINETRAFAISKAFENIGLNASQFANSITQFQMRFFRDFRLPLLLTRFGVDVSSLFRASGFSNRYGVTQISSSNILAFIEEIQKVGLALRRLPPFQRAFLAQTLGKDLVDMATILQRYNISQIIKDYMKVFSPQMIAQTRITILNLQLAIAQFWQFIIPFINQLSNIISRIAKALRSIGELYENNKLFRAIANVFILFTSLGAIFISSMYIVRLYRNSLESLSILFAIGRFYIDKATASLFKFTASLQNVSTMAGVAQFMQTGIGVGALTTSLIASLFTGLIGIIGLGFIINELRGLNDVNEAIKDNTADIASNTALTNIYLSNLTSDIRSLIKTTALGGNVAPFYQILNLQMMMQYGIMTNTSAI